MKEIDLYDYQIEAVEELRGKMAGGSKNLVLCAPTGSGKTVMATYLIKAAHEKRRRAIFICDRIALINQTSRTLDQYGIPHGVIQAQHWRSRLHERVQVASAQTLERRKWSTDYDLIIVDECHSARESIGKVLAKRETFAIGLTATPFTEGMAETWDDIVSVTTTNQLIQDKRLCPFVVYAPAAIDMEGAEEKAGEWTDRAAEERGLRVVGDVVVNYSKFAWGKKFICFGATIRHCEVLREQFMASGIRTELYVATTTDAERTMILEEYRKPDSKIRGLISVGALAKGFDVPDVSCVIICRPLKSSFAEHIQILGRGLRWDPQDEGKVCVVIDHAENTLRFGARMADFFQNSTKELLPKRSKKSKVKEYDPTLSYEIGDRVRLGPATYVAVRRVRPCEVPGISDAWDREAKPEKEWRKCPNCAAVLPPAPSCAACGHEFPKKAIIHEPGELVAVQYAAGLLDDQIRWWSELQGWAQRNIRGNARAWASYRFQERFGIPVPAKVKEIGSAAPGGEVSRWAQGKKMQYIIRHVKRKVNK
jgi:superfamily II DNA or RNA helicase